VRWDIAALRNQGTRRWFPQSGIDDNQGPPSMRPGELANLQIPRDPGANVLGFNNPYRLTFYGPIQLSTTISTQILSANKRRVYLLLQNQGPGNVWINFGANVSAANATANSNGLQLVTTQALEQIGGGFVTLSTGEVFPQAFVAGDFITAITDTVGTTFLAGEGAAIFPV
jgi:hypothetical protein